MRVIPAILTSDPGELRSMIQICEGVVERVQIDIIDGIFASNKTIDPQALEGIETDLLLDFHLMVSEPISWVERCARAQADRIIGHVERMQSQEEFIKKVQGVGASIGLALDLNTSVGVLEPGLLNSVDCILIMSVSAGFGGQEFHSSALKKISELENIRERDGLSFSILDDGGITLESVDEAKRAGVDEVAIGRRLFDGDLKDNLEKTVKASYMED